MKKSKTKDLIPALDLYKTRYCIHHHNCDRDEDCMAGEYCPFFANNPETYTMPRNVEIDTFEDIYNTKQN